MRGEGGIHGGLAVVLALAACDETRAPAPRVEIIGCQAWPADGACAVGSEPLTLWVEGVTAATVTLDGEPLVATPHIVQDGLQLRVTASAPGEPLPLAVNVEGRQPWTRRLVSSTRPEALDEVARLRRAGRIDEAEAALAALPADAPVPGATAEAARNALASGRIELARARFEAAIAEAVEQDRPRAELRDRTALTYLLVSHGYPPDAAREQLDALRPLAGREAEAALDLDYFEALFAAELRTPRPGLAALRRLTAGAERLGQDDVVLDAHQMHATFLVLTGRWPELATAIERLEEGLRRDDLSACRRADLRTNVGWYRLLLHRQAPGLAPRVPQAELQRATAAYATECPNPVRRANAALNEGWGALFAGDLDAAERHLATARAEGADAEAKGRLERDHLAAELALARGRHGAGLGDFEALGEAARELGLLTLEWRAAIGRGACLEGLGRRDAAIAAYETGARRLATLAARVPLGEGRDSFLFSRRDGEERLIRALTAAGRADAAIAAIGRARRGTLRWAQQHARLRAEGLDASRARLQANLRKARRRLNEAVRESQSLPADALAAERRRLEREALAARDALEALFGQPQRPKAPTPRPLGAREAAIHAFSSGRGMVAWLVTPKARHGLVLEARDLARLGAWSPHLALIARLYVHADPNLQGLDWAGWPLAHGPLFTRTSVVFPADLPATPRPVAAGRRAVVIADPSGAMPSARAEGATVAERLTARGWTVEQRAGPQGRDALLELLREPIDLWHYSGHGEQRGLDGLDSGLPLADGETFTVADALTLPLAPRRVVLAACELGRRGDGGAAGLGLAHALLVAGSEDVVAAVRAVEDEDAQAWVEAFHRIEGDAPDWAEALRRTRIELARTHPEVDGSAFRLWTR